MSEDVTSPPAPEPDPHAIPEGGPPDESPFSPQELDVEKRGYADESIRGQYGGK